jgi:heme/copper-type cytochrome/quinol oxidase subunit 2
LNETFDWWYVLVAVILLVPMFIGCCFNIVYFAEDTNASRSKLYVSAMLTIISVLCLATWNCFYIVYLYKYPDIQTEVGPKVTKKTFVIWSLYLATCIAFLWAYFICVTRDYYEALMSYEERMELKEKNKASGLFGVSLPKIPGMDNEDKMMEAAAMDPPKESAPASPKEGMM